MSSFFGTLLANVLRRPGALALSDKGIATGPGRRRGFRPALECLEEREVPTASITGQVVIDPTGNGYRPSDKGQCAVTVKLFIDSNQDGKLDTGDAQVGPAQATQGDGSFLFTGLAAGKYFVSEVTPSNFVRTTPTAQSYYTADLADGQTFSMANFANFQKLNTGLVSNISFTVTTPAGVSTTVTNLRGHTHQGDTVTANFTVASTASSVVVSLISYEAPGASFDANTASQQVPVEIATGTFGPGPQKLQVTIPNNFYQVDFVLGSAIDKLGPAGSNIFYSAQGRLLSADNSGSQAPPSTLSGFLFDTTNLPPVPGSSLVLTLTGVDSSGNSLPPITGTLDTTTGFYSIAGLTPGATYTLTVTDGSNIYQPLTSSPITLTTQGSITDYDLGLLLENPQS